MMQLSLEFERASDNRTEIRDLKNKNLQAVMNNLTYIKENLGSKTNLQIAEALGLSIGSLKWIMRTNNLTRNRQEYKALRKEIGKNFAGENNPNYRGGISKDYLRYKRIQLGRYPEHVKARIEARKALRKGILIKKPCEVCSNPEVDMHHEDHLRSLDVIFLCRTHHVIADRYLKAGIKFSMIKEKLKSEIKRAS